MRRHLIHLTLALIVIPATVVVVLKWFPEAPTSILVYPKPTHRVIMALDDILKSELAKVVPGTMDMSIPYQLLMSNGQMPAMNSTFVIPENEPAFWLDVATPLPAGVTTSAKPQRVPTLMKVDEMDFTGTTKDGRAIKVTVKNDSIGVGSVIDCHGDLALAQVISSRIADRLAHPKYKHESPDDRLLVNSFFCNLPLEQPSLPLMPLGPTDLAKGFLTMEALPPPSPLKPKGIVDFAVKQASGAVEVDLSEEPQ